jgi:hypothetical protein
MTITQTDKKYVMWIMEHSAFYWESVWDIANEMKVPTTYAQKVCDALIKEGKLCVETVLAPNGVYLNKYFLPPNFSKTIDK